MPGLFDLLFNKERLGNGLFATFAQGGGAQPALRQNQASPLDTAQYPAGPMGAPQQQQMQPQQPPPQQPSYFENGMGGLQSSPTLMGGLFNLIGGRNPAAGTTEALRKLGVPAELAPLVMKNPGVIAAVLQNKLGLGDQTNKIKEFQFAKQQGFTGGFLDFLKQGAKATGDGEYSLNPVYGTDDKGDTVLIQPGKRGEAIQTKLPPGIKISSGVDKIDLGDRYLLRDKRSGQPLGYEVKNIAAVEAQKKVGESQGTAQAALPAAMVAAEEAVTKIDELLAHKGVDSIVGSLDQYRPSWALGGQGRDAKARLAQLSGKAFLEARQMLKGAGPLTDFESKKGEEAFARLDRAQDEETFKLALKDFRDAVAGGIKKLKAQAGVGGQPSQALPDPLGLRR